MSYRVIRQEEILGNNPRIAIFGITIDVLGMRDTVNLVEKYVVTKTPLHLMGVNADKINEIKANERLKRIINSCGIINADGFNDTATTEIYTSLFVGSVRCV